MKNSVKKSLVFHIDFLNCEKCEKFLTSFPHIIFFQNNEMIEFLTFLEDYIITTKLLYLMI